MEIILKSRKEWLDDCYSHYRFCINENGYCQEYITEYEFNKLKAIELPYTSILIQMVTSRGNNKYKRILAMNLILAKYKKEYKK